MITGVESILPSNWMNFYWRNADGNKTNIVEATPISIRKNDGRYDVMRTRDLCGKHGPGRVSG